MAQKDSSFNSFHWHRIKIELKNVRLNAGVNIHPFVPVEAIVKEVTGKTAKENGAVFFHIPGRKHTAKLRREETLHVEVIFTNFSSDDVAQWLKIFAEYFEGGKKENNFAVAKINPVEERDYKTLCEECTVSKMEGEIALDFFTPIPFKPKKGKVRSYIEHGQFVTSFVNRFSRLFGAVVEYESPTDNFAVLPYYWNYTDVKLPSFFAAGEHAIRERVHRHNLFKRGVS